MASNYFVEQVTMTTEPVYSPEGDLNIFLLEEYSNEDMVAITSRMYDIIEFILRSNLAICYRGNEPTLVTANLQ